LQLPFGLRLAFLLLPLTYTNPGYLSDAVPWLAIPFVRVGAMLGIINGDLSFWLSIIIGFMLWTFIFARFFSSDWYQEMN